jgi:hypothetical protein
MERVARSLELLLRLKVEEVRGERNQKEMIHLLTKLGAKAGEIISLLGVSPAIVHPEMSRARSAKKTGRKRVGQNS